MSTFRPLTPIYEGYLNNDSMKKILISTTTKSSKTDRKVDFHASTKYLFEVHDSFHNPLDMIIKHKEINVDTHKNVKNMKHSLESMDDSHSKSTRSLSTEASYAATFYIVRSNCENSDHEDSPIELFEGAILGRTTVSRLSKKERRPRNADDLRRIDIGIGYYRNKRLRRSDDGVSRNQVEIIQICEDEIKIKVGKNARNPIAVWSGYHRRNYGAGEKVTLVDGDKIVFDVYMKEPKHIFEIVLSRNRNERRAIYAEV